MAAREHYKVKIACQGCGAVAMLVISEEDHPYVKRLDRAIDSVEGDFTARLEGRHDDVFVHCNKCGQDTEWK